MEVKDVGIRRGNCDALDRVCKGVVDGGLDRRA